MAEALLQVDRLEQALRRRGGVGRDHARRSDRRTARHHRPERRRQDHADRPVVGRDRRRTPAASASPARHHRACRPTGAASSGSRARSRSPRCFPISPRSTTWRSPSRRTAAIRSASGAMRDASRSCASPRARRSRASGLSERADVLVSSLSHGEHRQLEIAMALATKPRMLLLDEPMAGMGPEETARMVATLRELKRELTILLIEHDMEAVFALADRITVLVYGRVIASGTPDAIRANRGGAAGLSGRAGGGPWLSDGCSCAARGRRHRDLLRPEPGAVRHVARHRGRARW